MAEIQEYLTKILHAVFGRDVRQSIHDAIQQCYYDGKAGSIDLQARQKIETLASRMDNIVLSSTETLSGYELVEIYANSDYSGSEVSENVWSTSMLLSTTELDAVDWSHAEDVKIINVGAIDWNDGASYPDPELYKTLPYYHKDDMSVAIEMIDDAYAVSIMADEATKTYNRLYVKIVLAYKSHLSIPELEDLKVGADGTVYGSAGDAVRKQVCNLFEADEVLNQGGLDLKEEFIGAQVNEWLEEHPEATTTVQDGAITKGKLSNDLLSGLCVNALLLGFVPNDEDFDNSPILQSWLDGLQKGSPALYFPSGIYYFKTPVTLDKAGVGCTIKGDSAARDFIYISTVTGLPVAYNSSVLFFNAENSTFLTQVSNSPVTVKDLVFLSDSFKWNFDGEWNYRPTVPYNLFAYEISKENCNAVDVSAYNHCSLENCLFYGFSGYGLKTCKQNTVNNCKFDRCNAALNIVGNDCTLYNVYISNCVNGIFHEASTIFAWGLWVDCCAEYGIKAAEDLNGIIDGIIDHINYSAIYAKTSTHLKVDARINRCGMYWSGADSLDALKNDDLDVQFKNYSQAATISIHTCHGCDFNLQTSKRGLADDGEQKYYTPNVMINSVSWRQNNLQIPSTDIAVHDFWQISPAIYKTAHTHAGLVHGANIDKLYRHTENGCYICAYKVNDITYVDVRGVVNNDNITAPFTLFSDVDIALLQDIAPLKIPIIAGNNIFGALTSSDGIIFNYYNISGALANGNSVQGHITSM